MLEKPNIDRRTREEEIALWKELLHSFADGQNGFTITVDHTPSIIEILDVVGKHAAYSYFRSPYFKMEITGARESREKGLMEVDLDGRIQLIKPSSLTINLEHDDPALWDFKLCGLPFPKTGIDKEPSNPRNLEYMPEGLLESKDGEYFCYGSQWRNNMVIDKYGNEVPCPDDYRYITRWSEGGEWTIYSFYIYPLPNKEEV